MKRAIIDSHIHLDCYSEKDTENILQQLQTYQVTHLIAVSKHLESARNVQQLHRKDERIQPAYGYHPEQRLPSDNEIAELCAFIKNHEQEIVAIGEVGLPYYLVEGDKHIRKEPYIEILENFIVLAKKLDKPIVLHAVHSDASLVCDLLEKHSLHRAHFHWYKGDLQTTERMITNGYHISVTPDVVYKERTRNLVEKYPLELMMVETDGPWSFSGPFEQALTHPKMIHLTIETIAKIKQLPLDYVYEKLYDVTVQFYRLAMIRKSSEL